MSSNITSDAGPHISQAPPSYSIMPYTPDAVPQQQQQQSLPGAMLGDPHLQQIQNAVLVGQNYRDQLFAQCATGNHQEKTEYGVMWNYHARCVFHNWSDLFVYGQDGKMLALRRFIGEKINLITECLGCYLEQYHDDSGEPIILHAGIGPDPWKSARLVSQSRKIGLVA